MPQCPIAGDANEVKWDVRDFGSGDEVARLSVGQAGLSVEDLDDETRRDVVAQTADRVQVRETRRLFRAIQQTSNHKLHLFRFVVELLCGMRTTDPRQQRRGEVRKSGGGEKVAIFRQRKWVLKSLILTSPNSVKMGDYQPPEFCIFGREFSDKLKFSGSNCPPFATMPLHKKLKWPNTDWTKLEFHYFNLLYYRLVIQHAVQQVHETTPRIHPQQVVKVYSPRSTTNLQHFDT